MTYKNFIQKKYKQNLRLEGNKVMSYNTLVAVITEGGNLMPIDWNIKGKTKSPTTTKHINYIANELNLNIIQ